MSARRGVFEKVLKKGAIESSRAERDVHIQVCTSHPKLSELFVWRIEALTTLSLALVRGRWAVVAKRMSSVFSRRIHSCSLPKSRCL